MERQHQPGPVRKARVRTGCLTCRARKVKCDDERPVCFNCTRLNRACFYEPSPIDYYQPSQATTTNPRSLVAWTGAIVDYCGEPGAIETSFAPGKVADSGEALQTSPDGIQGSFEAMVGEWGDIFPASINQGSGLQPSPQYSSGDFALDLSQVVSTESQFSYFVTRVEPPYILPWDTSNWKQARIEMAHLGLHSPPIARALVALESLYKTLDEGGEAADTLPTYFAAKAAYTLSLDHLNTEQLFVATFLLCCFEVVAQQETVSSTLKQKDTLVTALESCADEKPWSPMVQRIITWLHLFHAKAMHLGGRGILSPKILSLLEDQQNTSLCIRSSSLNIDGLLNIATQSLQHSLFQFYYELQQISIMASSMNRHHRPRGTPADELKVDSISRVIERRLDNVWQGRPAILDCASSDLKLSIQCSGQDLADLALLARLCKLCYFAETIYYARSHGRATMSSDKIQSSRARIRSLIEEADTEVRDTLHHPALIWPLFLYSVESKSQDEVMWALHKFDLFSDPLWHTHFIKTFIQDLTAEQLRKGERVDSRYFCVEKFGVVPPFI